MGNIQVHLPDELEKALEAFADECDASLSRVMQDALAKGLSLMRLDEAVSRYGSGELSLEAAARFAGVSLSRLAREAAEEAIPYIRYGVDAAEADRRKAGELVQDAGEEGEPSG